MWTRAVTPAVTSRDATRPTCESRGLRCRQRSNRGRGTRKVRRWLAAGLLVGWGAAGGPAAAQDVLLGDGEFGNWVAAADAVVPPASYAASVGGGGNPGPQWSVSQTPLPGAYAAIVTYDAVRRYEPRASGALLALQFAFDHRFPAYRPSVQLSLAPIVRQGGSVFAAGRGFPAFAAPLWQRFTSGELVAAVFFNVGAEGPLHPDFSASGAPLELGLRVFRTSSPADSAAALAQIDNVLVVAVRGDAPPVVSFDTQRALYDESTGEALMIARERFVRGRPRVPVDFPVFLRLSRSVASPVRVTLTTTVGGRTTTHQRTFAPGTLTLPWKEPEDGPYSVVIEEPAVVVLDLRIAAVEGAALGAPSRLSYHLLLLEVQNETACAVCVYKLMGCVAAGLDGDLGGSGLAVCDPFGRREDDPCLTVIRQILQRPEGASRAARTVAGAASSLPIARPLRTLRRLRDELMVTTAAGRYYAALYRTISPALVDAIAARPSVLVDIAGAESDWVDGVEALLAGDGDRFVISPEMAAELSSILAKLEAAGSESLRRTLQQERSRLQLATLAGATMSEAWQRVNRLGGATGCTPSPSTLCLQGGRYAVEVDWATRDGQAGAGRAVALSGDTGVFSFFDTANVETVVKVLDGCAINGHRWVFAAGLTDLAVRTTVTDTWTGEGKRYESRHGTPFAPLQDTGFQRCDTALPPAAGARPPRERDAEARAGTASRPPLHGRRRPAAASGAAGDDGAGSCVATPTALCLAGGRFRVEATWRTADGRRGTGRATPLTGDTGTFWFFDRANVETMVKVLDGCAVNDAFWVFAAGLTDVAVELTVTDTRSGRRRTYANPLGRPFRPVQDTAALGGCS